MKFYKETQRQITHQWSRLGPGRLWSSSAEETLGVLVGSEESLSQQWALAAGMANNTWLSEAWQVYEGKGLFPSLQLSLDHTYNMASSTVPPSPSKRQTLTNWNDFRRGHQDGQGWSTCPVRASWRSLACLAWRRHGSRRNLTIAPVPMESSLRRWSQALHRGVCQEDETAEMGVSEWV